MNVRYTTITEYRVLPPRARIIYPEVVDPGERCVRDADDLLRPREADAASYAATGDIASLVFNAQATQHEASSRNMSRLIGDRMALADRHIEEIKHRLHELKARIPPSQSPFGPSPDGSLSDVERQVFDLEKQRREVQAKLWKDVVELRTELLGERSEYQGARRRFSFFSGGYGGGEVR